MNTVSLWSTKKVPEIMVSFLIFIDNLCQGLQMTADSLRGDTLSVLGIYAFVH